MANDKQLAGCLQEFEGKLPNLVTQESRFIEAVDEHRGILFNRRLADSLAKVASGSAKRRRGIKARIADADLNGSMTR